AALGWRVVRDPPRDARGSLAARGEDGGEQSGLADDAGHLRPARGTHRARTLLVLVEAAGHVGCHAVAEDARHVGCHEPRLATLVGDDGYVLPLELEGLHRGWVLE